MQRWGVLLLCSAVSMFSSTLARGQAELKVLSATPAVIKLFESHDIVMLGESHGSKQEYDWLRSLVANPQFADVIDDIAVEFGNSRFQQAVDRYESGAEMPIEEVQGAWRDTVAAVGPPSPVYASLYTAVREVNIRRKGRHQIRILCGDSPIDWSQVREGKDIVPFLSTREQSYAGVVEKEVIAKHHHALLIMGAFHFLRNLDLMPGGKPFDIEKQLRAAGARPYLVVTGTNTTAKPDQLDARFDGWKVPAIVPVADNWVGDLPAVPVVTAGHGPVTKLRLKDATDALLYFGPPSALTTVQMSPTELNGTPYGAELERRQRLQMSLEH